MALPTVTNFAVIKDPLDGAQIFTLFSDGQIQEGRQVNGSQWVWNVVSPATPSNSAPTVLTYGANPVVFRRGTPQSDHAFLSTGLNVTYTVGTALPSGLNLNPKTGEIFGTATALVAAADYVVTATNDYGNTTVTLNLASVEALTYSFSYGASQTKVYTNGTAITNLTPSYLGGAIVSYAVSPALPTGITLNTSTGVISGTPSVVVAAADYTITGTHTGGTVTTVLHITVNDVAPSALTYSVNPATFSIAAGAITPDTPSHSGGTVISYAITPALPTGLAFSTSTGIISGTPSATHTASDFVVTATNSGGSTTATVNITVTA